MPLGPEQPLAARASRVLCWHAGSRGDGAMARVQLAVPTSIEDAQDQLQIAIGVEFGTLPPYLYTMFSIPPEENVASAQLIKSVLMQEMVHMCLACNILNAIGGNPVLTPP